MIATQPNDGPATLQQHWTENRPGTPGIQVHTDGGEDYMRSMRPGSGTCVLPSKAEGGASRTVVPAAPRKRSSGRATVPAISDRPVGKAERTLQQDVMNWGPPANRDIAPVILSSAPLLLVVNPSQAALPLEAYQVRIAAWTIFGCLLCQ